MKTVEGTVTHTDALLPSLPFLESKTSPQGSACANPTCKTGIPCTQSKTLNFEFETFYLSD